MITAAVAMALVLWLPASAAAKTTVKRQNVGGTMTISIVGDAGEEHDVMVEFDDEENLYFITDDSATLDAGSGCTYRSADAMAVCTVGSPAVSLLNVTTAERDDSVLLDLEAGERSVIASGAGDDFIKGLEARDEIDAGAGSDVVDGGDGNDAVLGGPGDDVLDGGWGDDFVDGGGEDDSLNGDLGSDYLSGGGGTDTADYGGYKASVFVDADGNADDGQAGEHDNVAADIENLKGGSGADTLTGNAAVNVLSGAGGDDSINSRDESADTVLCGSGVDSAVADDRDTGDRCERVDRGAAGVPAGFKVKIVACGSAKIKNKACVQVSCPGAKGACKGAVTLKTTQRSAGKSKSRKRSKGKVVQLGSAKFATASSRAAKVTVKLSKQGVKLLKKQRKLTAAADVEVKDAAGQSEGHTASLKLRSAKTKRR